MGSSNNDQTPPASTPAQDSLVAAVVEIERHVATAGWDGPVRVFALVRTAEAIEKDPAITSILTPDVVARAKFDAHHLTSIEQEDLPPAASLGELLARLAWPERSEEHTSELQSRGHLVCRLLLEKKNTMLRSL